MRALKSELAKQMLADKENAEDLRRSVERAVSSRAKNQPQTVEFKDKDGTTRRFRLRVMRTSA